MHPLHKPMLRAVVLAAALAAPAAARADAFAQSILTIDNLRLLHANGTTYAARDFATLSGGAAAYAGAFLDGAADAQFHAGAGNIDLAQRGVGADLPARPENQFAPLPGAAGDFAAADQRMAGAVLGSNWQPAGALLQTRADAALAGAGAATGFAGIGGSASFSFSLGRGDSMTIAFDALPFTQAYAGAPASASAGLSWTISVTDLSTGASVFGFQPKQLNALSNVSRSGEPDGGATYAPGWLAFAASTSMFDAGDIYQVSIGQGSYASALQQQPVPEPATLAGLGAGLLAMAALGRRRRRDGRATGAQGNS